MPADVVLEVGGGLGVLSEYLAPRVAHLHVVEVDRSLEPPLREALDPFPNATLHLADAVTLDLAALDPPPDKVVANLPYGVAATVLLRTVEELAEVTLWVAMVQREVGERLAAAPGSKTYGATSVLAQLACEVKVLRRVPRTVFHPEPNVESALVALRRTGPAPEPAVSGARPRRVRPPAQGARRGRWRWRRAPARGSATVPARRSSSSGTPPTRAPSGWRRRTSRGWPKRSARVP